LAVVGFPAPPAPPDTVTGVIVDARGVLTRPALGFWLRGGEADASDAGYAGPVVFYRDPTRAGADPRLGARVWRVRATAVAGGVVTVESAPASSQAASKPAAKATVQGAAALSALTRERPLVAVILGAE
jgi:hypothetical protein